MGRSSCVWTARTAWPWLRCLVRVRYTFRAICFFFQAEDGIRDIGVTGVQTCALPIWPPAATPASAGEAATPVIAGGTEIKDVNEAYGLTLDDSDYTTIGGLLFGTLGRLPKVGDQVRLSGATFEILEMEGRRVGKVRVAPPPAPSPTAEG